MFKCMTLLILIIDVIYNNLILYQNHHFVIIFLLYKLYIYKYMYIYLCSYNNNIVVNNKIKQCNLLHKLKNNYRLTHKSILENSFFFFSFCFPPEKPNEYCVFIQIKPKNIITEYNLRKFDFYKKNQNG